MLLGGDEDVNLHVFSAGCPEIERMLRFRDRLRSSAADRELYAAAKRELAARDWRHVQDYADAKTDVIDEIVARASARQVEQRQEDVDDRDEDPGREPDHVVLGADGGGCS